MEMRYRRLALLISLIPLVLLSCTTDGSSQTSRTNNSTASSAAQVPQQQTLRDREKAVRQQLSDTTDGEARYALLDGLASGYFRAGMVADSMRVREQIVEDSRIPAGRRSLTASSLAEGYSQGFDYARSATQRRQNSRPCRASHPMLTSPPKQKSTVGTLTGTTSRCSSAGKARNSPGVTSTTRHSVSDDTRRQSTNSSTTFPN
jgi:hypothetical protein